MLRRLKSIWINPATLFFVLLPVINIQADELYAPETTNPLFDGCSCQGLVESSMYLYVPSDNVAQRAMKKQIREYASENGLGLVVAKDEHCGSVECTGHYSDPFKKKADSKRSSPLEMGSAYKTMPHVERKLNRKPTSHRMSGFSAVIAMAANERLAGANVWRRSSRPEIPTVAMKKARNTAGSPPTNSV